MNSVVGTKDSCEQEDDRLLAMDEEDDDATNHIDKEPNPDEEPTEKFEGSRQPVKEKEE